MCIRDRRLPVCKAVLHFNTKKDEEVLVKVGVSAVDIAGARKNVESEIPEWDFDKEMCIRDRYLTVLRSMQKAVVR